MNVGDAVVWEWGPGGSGTLAPHTVTHCADSLDSCGGARAWDSSPATTTGTFSHTFGPEDAGKTFLYRCQIHPTTMRGRIIVQAIAAPTPTNTPTPTPTHTRTPMAIATQTATPQATSAPTPMTTVIPTATPAPTQSPVTVAIQTATPAPTQVPGLAAAATAVAGTTLPPTPSVSSIPSAGGSPPQPSGNDILSAALAGGVAIALGLAALLWRRNKA
ncbi:MAG: hypothetical protein V3S20_09470 [Dehalococcoidia bacterium]